MIKPNPKNGTGSKLEQILMIRYSEMAIPSCKEVLDQGSKLTLAAIASSKLFFGLTCPSSKLTKCSVSNKII